jgi:hypothetical protein
MKYIHAFMGLLLFLPACQGVQKQEASSLDKVVTSQILLGECISQNVHQYPRAQRTCPLSDSVLE